MSTTQTKQAQLRKHDPYKRKTLREASNFSKVIVLLQMVQE
jgi:hypothetical protein